MTKVTYHEIPESGTFNYAIIDSGKPLVIFKGENKRNYKPYFALKGIEVMRLMSNDGNNLAELREQMREEKG